MSDGCQRLRLALAEQDHEDAQRRTNSALEAVYAAEQALADARDELDRARGDEWRRRYDLYRARRADA